MAGAGEQGLQFVDLLHLAAVDTNLFNHHFFPRAFRDGDPAFADELNKCLEDPRTRLLAVKMFRGAAKTTRLRAFAAKRVAYGLSKTILYVGASEGHATRSVTWLKNQIEPRMGGDGTMRQTPYAKAFGLKPGKKWSEHDIEIIQSLPKADGTTEERTYWVLGVGITGNIRGINFEDYRPDLIILDDVITDENSATGPQRDKISDLIMGALVNSLAPATEEPNAKLVMLQTPLDPDDASARAERSPEWSTVSYGCWTKATEDLPTDYQQSSWEVRYPTTTLRRQKTSAIIDNRYSIFAREMECKIASAETLSFRKDWLIRLEVIDKWSQCVISLDPVPPPSDAQAAKGMKGKDFEAIGVVARSEGRYGMLAYQTSRGHAPDWTSKVFFEYLRLYRPVGAVLSLVSAERYLRWYLEKEMARKRAFTPIYEAPIGGKSKFARITGALTGPGAQGKLFCMINMPELILQWEGYGVGYKGNDDVLEMFANGVAHLMNPYLEAVESGRLNEDVDMPRLRVARCP